MSKKAFQSRKMTNKEVVAKRERDPESFDAEMGARLRQWIAQGNDPRMSQVVDPALKQKVAEKVRPTLEDTINFSEAEGSVVQPIDPNWYPILGLHSQTAPAGVIKSTAGTPPGFIPSSRLAMDNINSIANDVKQDRKFAGNKIGNQKDILGFHWKDMPPELKVTLYPKISQPTIEEEQDYNQALAEMARQKMAQQSKKVSGK